MNERLQQELRTARFQAAADATTEAERHIRDALKLVYAAPVGSVCRRVRARVQEAAFAIAQRDARLATSAIDKALQELGEGAIAED